MSARVTVEQFAQNLAEILERQGPARMTYTFTDQLADAVNTAAGLQPQSESGYPRMLYLGGDRNNFRIVENGEQQRAAEAAGYTPEASAQYAEGFPASFVETPASGRGSDLRRVLIRTSGELEQWKTLTDDGQNWIRDNAQTLGGRPTNLEELVNEREAALARALHEELRQPPKKG